MKWRLLTIQSVYIFVISIVIFLQQGVELPVHSMQEFCLETHFESWSLHRLHGDWKPQLGVLSQVQLERRGLALAKTDNRKTKMKMPPSEQVAGPALTSRKVDHNLHVNTFYHVTFDMYFPSNFQVLFFSQNFVLHDPLSYFSELLPARVWSLCIRGRAEFWPVLPAELAPCLGPLLFSEFWRVLREGVLRHFNKNQCKSDLIWFWQNWDKTLSNKHRSHIRKIAWFRNRINHFNVECFAKTRHN